MEIKQLLMTLGNQTYFSKLSPKEKELIIQALTYLNEEKAFESAPVEEKGYNYEYTFIDNETDKEQTVVQLSQYFKFRKDLYVQLLKTEDDDKDPTYLVRVVTLTTDKGEKLSAELGENLKTIVVFMDGEFLAEHETPTPDTELTLPNEEDEEVDNASESKEDAHVLSGWGLPCIQNGCCSFRYNGIGKLYRYKWCGANCGSGTPINALDRCCKMHDECYSYYSTYPNRCGCDRVLISCASKTDNAGTTRIIAAFRAKMFAKGCPK